MGAWAESGQERLPVAGAVRARRYVITVGGRDLVVSLHDGPAGRRATIDGQEVDFQLRPASQPVVAGVLEGRWFRALARRDGDEVVVVVRGEALRVRVRDERQQLLERVAAPARVLAHEQVIRAPMSGLVVGLLVAVGDVIEAGQCVAILQAMKMENELRATAPGRVAEVRVEVGQTVEARQVLMVVR